MSCTESELCKMVCSSDFTCRWAKWDQIKHVTFPDGSTQSCVGAQVRCGCTFVMWLVSYITYEHPSAILLPCLFIATISIYMLIRCIVLYESFNIFHWFPIRPQPGRKLSAVLSESYPATDYQRDPRETNVRQIISASVITISNASDYYSFSDKPPPYSAVIENDMPPSYKECVHIKAHII